MNSNISTIQCNESHTIYIPQVLQLIDQVNKEPGVALARRTFDEIHSKIISETSALALDDNNQVVGFVYVAPWENGKFVATSALVVDPKYRGMGIGRKLKDVSLIIAERKFPDATPFGITLSSKVMKLNAEVGFLPVAYDQITTDPAFWQGCSTCPYYQTLLSMNKERCFCTALVLKK